MTDSTMVALLVASLGIGALVYAVCYALVGKNAENRAETAGQAMTAVSFVLWMFALAAGVTFR